MKHIIVIATCVDEREANLLATALIERRLSACVQASQITSTYRWKGAIEHASEVRIMIKAREADFGEIEALIKGMLSYENPEVIAIPLSAGSRSYLDWIDQETAR